MKINKLLIIILCLLFPCFACKKKEENDGGPEARELFSRSSKTILEAIKELGLANDSMSVDSLQTLFEKKITDINFSFPAQTDLNLTEQENDSLFKLLQDLESLRKEKLLHFSRMYLDTIPEE